MNHEPTPGKLLYERSRSDISDMHGTPNDPGDYGGHVIRAVLSDGPSDSRREVTAADHQLDLFGAAEKVATLPASDVFDNEGFRLPTSLQGLRADAIPSTAEEQAVACGDCGPVGCGHVTDTRIRSKPNR